MHRLSTLAEVFLVFLRLGLSSFGGPVAHLGYFHETFVRRRGWLSENDYAQMVLLCQLLPGASSSQVGMTIGVLRAGPWGALAAWLGFTLPSAVVMTMFALVLQNFSSALSSSALHGLKWAALAVVAHALVAMARALCPDVSRRVLAVFTALPLVFVEHSGLQLALLALGGLVGMVFFAESPAPQGPELSPRLSTKLGWTALFFFFVLLFALPFFAHAFGHPFFILFDVFFRTGALVFGGGHVVLPLLTREFVDPGILSADVFLAGYGAAQTVPGPLFSFAGFLGAASVGLGGTPLQSAFVAPPLLVTGVSPVAAAAVSIVAIFLPSFLLLFGVLPFWGRLQGFHVVRKALTGFHASVVGFLLAALLLPFLVQPAPPWQGLLLFLGAFAALQFLRCPAWFVVLLSGFGSMALSWPANP